MPLPASIDRLSERNFVGLCHLDVVDVADVDTMPDEYDGNVVGDVELKEDKSWTRIYLDDNGGLFSDKWGLEDGAQYSEATITGAIAKDRLALMPRLWDLKGRRYLVIFTTRNGDQLLMGTPKYPATALVAERTAGDDPDSDRNEYTVEFSLTRRLPVPFYNGTPPTPGAGGPGDPATVQSAASTPLYSTTVASGGTLTLPTANVIKADGTDMAVEYRPAATSDIYIEQNHIEVLFDAIDGESLELTINAAKAGTYTVLAQDGSSGTITFSKNGGAFGAIGGGIALADTDTIQVRRTATSAEGWVRISTNNA